MDALENALARARDAQMTVMRTARERVEGMRENVDDAVGNLVAATEVFGSSMVFGSLREYGWGEVWGIPVDGALSVGGLLTATAMSLSDKDNVYKPHVLAFTYGAMGSWGAASGATLMRRLTRPDPAVPALPPPEQPQAPQLRGGAAAQGHVLPPGNSPPRGVMLADMALADAIGRMR
ncbi:hypothetical protein [Sandaracinus amylolyticus]|uniref:hypothetical protein n=1 Tax=Sandaracinus amylolyticus TaxID=927083 RepID=UPI001F3DA530|nr:hypothetical protein [Sandaracinus amylolyticus]